MQRANRNIHNITVKELCPIGDAVKILFWAYDNEGNFNVVVLFSKKCGSQYDSKFS